jgi:hypothetical protein
MMEREYKKTPYGEDRRRQDMVTREPNIGGTL